MNTGMQICLLFALLCAGGAPAGETVYVRSSLDATDQPCHFHASSKQGPQPLLVLLHPWSHGYNTFDLSPWVTRAQARGWHVLIPHFRGPNTNPSACASAEARQDILDAVEWAGTHHELDRRRVYLAGTSGGAHMALVMAAEAPSLWAAVSAWCAISDLTAWHDECRNAGRKYWKDIQSIVGGVPGSSPEIDRQLRLRSPLFSIVKAKDVPLDLNAGIRDGHTGSVPIHHSLDVFNVIAQQHDAPVIDFRTIERLSRGDRPETHEADDPAYGRSIYLRRDAGPSRVTIFDGGHEDIPEAALAWLENNSRSEVR